MTLCGVLKDIILVGASMLIWGTQVSPLQFFGYSIALGGLVYYKLGGDSIKGYFAEGDRAWAEYGVKHRALRKVIVFAVVLVVLFLLLGGFAPTVGYNPTSAITNSKYMTSLVGDKPT